MINFRNVEMKFLDQIETIENEGFPKEEAATKEAFLKRIQRIPDTFIVAEKNGEVLGYVNGPVINQIYITDDLFKDISENPKTGGYQSILGLVVAKKARNQGIAKALMKKIEEISIKNEREGITLTCKQDLIPFYEQLGFKNHGLSESTHGGVSWYNMVKLLK